MPKNNNKELVTNDLTATDKPKRAKKKTRRAWSQEDEDGLIADFPSMSYEKLRKKFKRPYSSVVNKCVALGLSKRNNIVKPNLPIKNAEYTKIRIDDMPVSDTLDLLLYAKEQGFTTQIG